MVRKARSAVIAVPEPPNPPRTVRGPGLRTTEALWVPPKPPPRASAAISFIPLGAMEREFPCGHQSTVRMRFDFFGEIQEMSKDAQFAKEQCGPCLVAEIQPLVARCVLCGRAIFPGQAVALYRNDPELFADRPWKQTIGSEDGAVVGCLRRDCCPSPDFHAHKRWNGTTIEPIPPPSVRGDISAPRVTRLKKEDDDEA